MKICTKCGDSKFLEDFPRKRSNSDERRSACKKCTSLSNVVWAQQNPENTSSAKRPERRRETQLAWQKANKDRLKELKRLRIEQDPEKHLESKKLHYKKYQNSIREKQRDSRYGLNEGEYDSLLMAQNFVCAICKHPEEGKRGKLHVDHDHKMGFVRNAVRGLLCHRCNAGLGHFKDDPELLIKAAEYIKKHQSSGLVEI